MRIPRPIDATQHGIVDYTAGANLMALAPRLFGVEGTRSARQIRIAGAFHTGYSLFTDYPLGAVKALPYRAHLALDALGALALAATPFVTGQYKRGPRQFVPHLALAAFELGSLAMTDPTGRGDYHGDVDVVRDANEEDPVAKVRDTHPAVAPQPETAAAPQPQAAIPPS